jgi:uncharacterized protein (TIGR02466 family)
MSQDPSKQRVVSLFPTPVLVIEQLLAVDEVEAAREYIYSAACEANGDSPYLRHTSIFSGTLPPSFQPIQAALLPQVALLSGIMLGQALKWRISGMWGNIGREGAVQQSHNHANSIISGIVYLTGEGPTGMTRFYRPRCSLGPSFENRNSEVSNNVFNAVAWHLESVKPGDAILFPSHLMHEVPKIVGHDRLTVAFNALPHELNCSGYIVRFEQSSSQHFIE